MSKSQVPRPSHKRSSSVMQASSTPSTLATSSATATSPSSSPPTKIRATRAEFLSHRLHEEINPFLERPETLVDLAVLVLGARTGCASALGVPVDVLTRFVQRVRTGYNDNAYHNWHHAFHVFLNCYRYMSDSVEKLGHLHVFAILVSALTHDLDHQGVPNSALHSQGHPVAAKYPKSSAEMHSIAIGLSLLSDAECNVMEAVQRTNPAGAETLRILVRELIAATDVADHEVLERTYAAWRKHGYQLCGGHMDVSEAPSAETIASNQTDAASAAAAAAAAGANGPASQAPADGLEDVPLEQRISCFQILLLCADVGIVGDKRNVFLGGARHLYEEIKAHSGLELAAFCSSQSKFLDSHAATVYRSLHGCGLVPAFERYYWQYEGNRAFWQSMEVAQQVKIMEEAVFAFAENGNGASAPNGSASGDA